MYKNCQEYIAKKPKKSIFILAMRLERFAIKNEIPKKDYKRKQIGHITKQSKSNPPEIICPNFPHKLKLLSTNKNTHCKNGKYNNLISNSGLLLLFFQCQFRLFSGVLFPFAVVFSPRRCFSCFSSCLLLSSSHSKFLLNLNLKYLNRVRKRNIL